ncbi:hypothetical protein PVAP13_4NG019300 [Panicum virgatum]|uniref:Uncharacterized protein n=1 Tax=Panicum virgatum TaxID=38727 RepID=A0A8T0T3S8_PANVG|nr:hypothetical protein PVAP13_4NG019300 [Panicum virgatum]
MPCHRPMVHGPSLPSETMSSLRSAWRIVGGAAPGFAGGRDHRLLRGRGLRLQARHLPFLLRRRPVAAAALGLARRLHVAGLPGHVVHGPVPAARAGGSAAEVHLDRGLRRRRRRSQRDGDRRPGRRRRGLPRPDGLDGRRRGVHRRAPRVLGVACSQVRRRGRRPVGEWQALCCTIAGLAL